MLRREHIVDLVELRLTDEQARSVLAELSADRLTVKLIREFVAVMHEDIRDHAEALRGIGENSLDCCGTGGSGMSRYNTSTTAAFVLAAGGVPVTKFGNRASSSNCGSFDLLEALGFPIELDSERVVKAFKDTNLALLFAPSFYPRLAKLAPLRRTVAVKTIFNYVGPLLNPVIPAYRVVGVSDPQVQVLIASYLSVQPEVKRAFVVRGSNDLDEITANGVNQIYDVQNGSVQSIRFVASSAFDKLPVLSADHSAQQSAELFKRLLNGDDELAYYRRMVCLNAGAGFYATGKSESIEAGAELAGNLLSSGEVLRKFEQCRRVYDRILV